jgi:hypothetical protein
VVEILTVEMDRLAHDVSQMKTFAALPRRTIGFARLCPSQFTLATKQTHAFRKARRRFAQSPAAVLQVTQSGEGSEARQTVPRRSKVLATFVTFDPREK